LVSICSRNTCVCNNANTNNRIACLTKNAITTWIHDVHTSTYICTTMSARKLSPVEKDPAVPSPTIVWPKEVPYFDICIRWLAKISNIKGKVIIDIYTTRYVELIRLRSCGCISSDDCRNWWVWCKTCYFVIAVSTHIYVSIFVNKHMVNWLDPNNSRYGWWICSIYWPFSYSIISWIANT
jgi:hypothetical protein